MISTILIFLFVLQIVNLVLIFVEINTDIYKKLNRNKILIRLIPILFRIFIYDS
jgi:hypothetical protein